MISSIRLSNFRLLIFYKKKTIDRIMTKKEILPFVLAVIGLIANLIGIGTFIYSSSAQNNLEITISGRTVFITSQIILFYSWFVIVWFLSRLNYLQDISKSKFQRDRAVIRTAIVSIGIVIFPINMLICWILNESFLLNLTIFFIIGGLLIYEGVKAILTIVYPEMNRYIHRTGIYFSKKTISIGDIQIQKDEIVVVLKRSLPEAINYIPVYGWLIMIVEGEQYIVKAEENGYEFTVPYHFIISDFAVKND